MAIDDDPSIELRADARPVCGVGGDGAGAAAGPSPAIEPLSRIAFGSCANQEKPQPIWDAVLAARPQLLLLFGDNIYADTEDMDVMRRKYAKVAAKPGTRSMRAGCPILAVWDDHDLGANDAGGDFLRSRPAPTIGRADVPSDTGPT
jgi:alkaline phosphatase D